MKQFVGKKVEFIVESIGAFSATVVSDRKDMVLVKGDKDKHARRIVKSKIISFMPLEDVADDVNLLVLSCENPTIGCPGVQYIKEGEGFNKKDFMKFMVPCPARCQTCRPQSLGELRTLPGDVVRDMMSGTLYGDYPEAKEVENGE